MSNGNRKEFLNSGILGGGAGVAEKRGFRAIRVQAGVPGLKRIYGVHAPDENHEAPQQAPDEGDWNTPAYLRLAPELFAAVRDRLGPELTILHDAHHRLSPNEAAQLGRSLEPYGLFWLEDAVPAEDQTGWRRLRAMRLAFAKLRAALGHEGEMP